MLPVVSAHSEFANYNFILEGIVRKPVFISLILLGALALGIPSGLAQKKDKKKSQAVAVVATAAGPHGNAEAITAAQLKDYLTFIASDEMEGRDTPSRGLNTVAKFIAMNLSRWGLQPAGDDKTYFQRINLKRSKVDPAHTTARINGTSFTTGTDFIASATAGTASGPLLYAGPGWVVKSKGIDAYKGVSVKDKIVVVFGGLPKGLSFNDLKGEPGGDWDNPGSYVLRNGGKGVIVIPNPGVLNNWNERAKQMMERSTLSPEKLRNSTPQAPTITVSTPMINALFAGEKINGEALLKSGAAAEYGESFDLGAGKTVNFTIGVQDENIPTQNVVAVLEGSDPVLKNEYVAIGAHYDHVGMRASGDGDRIFNGADDDGSGTTGVLAIAEAFASGPRPKRSILFVWHCGEEKGLWGSEYFTKFPTIPLSQIITQLNIDMIGRSKTIANSGDARNKELSEPNEIYVIGSKMMSSELGQLSEAVNKSYLRISFNYKYDDPKDPNRFFFRSDHFNYAQKGIPIIFYFDGVHEDYHQVSDEVSKIDFAKMEKVSRTVYATAWELANTAKRPTVDKQLPAELTKGS